MRRVTRLETGNSIVRHVDHRRRGHYYWKFVIVISLLIAVVVVQLLIDCRYTGWLTFAVSSIVDISATDERIEDDFNSKDTSMPDSQWVIHSDNGMGLLFKMKAYDATAAKKALRKVGNRTCFVEGLDKRNGARTTADGCPCKADWFGTACSVPGFISRSPTPWSKDSLRIRARPRRIIHAFPFNIEFDMLELRFAELADVVDVFLVLESNYTAYGTPKPLRLLDRLRNGTLQNVAGKVVHILLDYFPRKAYRDGWVADALHRNYLGTHGLRRLGGLRSDDLLVLTDADELPRRQLLSFLRWHDGYSEPVVFNYRWSVYGFFWGVPESNKVIKTQSTSAAVTVAMAVYVLRYKLYFIRTASTFIRQHAFDVQVMLVASSRPTFFYVYRGVL